MIDIRVADADDAGAIAEIYAPYVTNGHVSFESEAPGAETMRARMAKHGGFYPWLVATIGEDGGMPRIVGYAYAAPFRDRPAYRYIVEASIYVSQEDTRRGVGRLLYGALMDTLRAQDFTRAVAVLALPNEASIRLHEAVGFHRAGAIGEAGFKRNQWIDIGFWVCKLNDSALPPQEPRPFSTVGLVRY
ncbi:GNAT family N-acetyltransferase [Stakelama saccharophila]|uniref:GNAT family N-acetyltransferase n=1 Tax=Stakelama saccharophila TaxID=3075605 RepID=A0ABZ0BAX7_9SPHN|nr:GNAT family N-acetyltransferase [Stakelama sp. W311]WNO54420.1 GNAT family N-acetyltransferase [Stakelama sp. W311]